MPAFAQPVSLQYYLPDSVQYDADIPVPKSVIGHEVGEWHVTHDKLVYYMQAVAAACPQRIKLEVTGTTYEGRHQLLLIITSPANQQRLEQIREEHVKLIEASQSGNLNVSKMPAVLWIGYSIHGNESSGANASLLAAYYLAAAKGPQIDQLLDNTVILLDPSFNPDGLNRFATWANQHRSKNLVSDPNSREFNEVWPGGRFNHYWFDLNRDWLPAVHVESQNRLKYFHQWKPNVLTDHHEMGSNATFFFQPGVPSRVNPITPAKNQELTAKIGKYHARFLDRIGSLYFTKEGYDDFYYGKGSTYPDVNGAVGILFEQASSRGHVQQTANGLLTFPFTIRNQFTTTLSTLEAVKELRTELLGWQRDFYKQTAQEGAASGNKAYVVASGGDKYRLGLFAQMLQRHQIEVYANKSTVSSVDGYSNVAAGDAFVVPLNQTQHRLIRAIFEKQLQFTDSLFYDVTSWTMPLAFGLPYQLMDNGASLAASDVVSPASFMNAPAAPPKGAYGYLMTWSSFEAPKALHKMLAKGVLAKAATNNIELEISGKPRLFHRGTIVIPAQGQSLSADALQSAVTEVAKTCAVEIVPIATGNVLSGSDLGSAKMVTLQKPNIAMLVGTGVNPTDAGEIWHLLDQRMDIPATHLEIATFNRVDAGKYNVLIMPGGGYDGLNKDKLRAWVSSGGVVVACEDALNWLAENSITSVNIKRAASPFDSLKNVRYADREEIDGAQRMNGAIFRANVDTTHPLFYGYANSYIDLFKGNTVFVQRPKNQLASPATYGGSPLVSGYVTRENYNAIKNSAAVTVQALGSGRVVQIADNPSFRAFWLGGTRLFMNAIFFGKLIDAASARGDE